MTEAASSGSRRWLWNNLAFSAAAVAVSACLLSALTGESRLELRYAARASVVLGVLLSFCFQNVLLLFVVNGRRALGVSLALQSALLSTQLFGVICVGRAFVPTDFLNLREALAVAPSSLRPAAVPIAVFFLCAATLAALVFLSGRSAARGPGLRARLKLALPSALFILAAVFHSDLDLDLRLRSLGVINGIWDQAGNLGRNGMLLAWTLNLRPAYVPNPGAAEAEIRRIHASAWSGDAGSGPRAGEKINLIVYMMESFVDPAAIGVRPSRDPTPFFRSLARRWPSGVLTTPAFGGNTSSVEFEVLTAMRMGALPPGSVPYEQYLKRPVRSLAGILKDVGYRSIAIHPNHDWFWSRREVYPRLGFDRFLSLTDFNGAAKIGPYVDDGELVSKIIETSRGPEPFFIFALTMATHWDFDWPLESPREVFALNELDARARRPVDTYLRLLARSDRAFSRLVRHFEKDPRKTLIVAFGDHAPPLGKNAFDALDPEERLRKSKGGRVRSLTPLLFWANFKLPKENISLPSYALGPAILDRLGVRKEPLFELAAVLAKDSPERSSLARRHEILQYDRLFGRQLSSRAPTLVAHAGGEFGGRPYTNSLEALGRSAERGFRLFELDFESTTDGRLVLLHDWEKTLRREFGVGAGRRSEREFLALKAGAGFTQLSAAGLFRWLKSHPSARIVTDVKSDNLKALAWLKANQPDCATRFIPQIYSFDEYEPVRELGYEDIILTLYRSSAGDDEILDFCRTRRLFAVTMPASRAAGTALADRLIASGMAVYAHTVNDARLYRTLLGKGLAGVYTDSLR